MEKTNYTEELHREIIGMNKCENTNIGHMMIGMNAPNFSADTTFGLCKLSDYTGKWLVFFSHPGDFTPVCTTEFISFARHFSEFTKRNCCLLGLSIDSTPSHLAWLYNIYKCTGMHIPFPIVSDRDMSIAKMYGMLPATQNATQTVRSVFIIDPEQKIRAILQYPLTNGRSIPEILRLIDGLQITDSDKVVTPANWMPNQPVIVPYPKTYDELLERVKNPAGYNCMDWYLCFKQDANCIPTSIGQNNMMCNLNSMCNNTFINEQDCQPFNNNLESNNQGCCMQ